MNALSWIGVTAGAMLVAGAWVWWRHRTALVDFQRRLDRSERSCVALELRAQDLDLRLSALSQALQAVRPQGLAHLPLLPAESTVAAPPSGDVSQRRRLLEEALDLADAAAAATLAQGDSAVPRTWKDTEPLPLPDSCYAPTMPLELHDEERSFPPQRSARRSPG